MVGAKGRLSLPPSGGGGREDFKSHTRAES